jgi:hypothetical protein
MDGFCLSVVVVTKGEISQSLMLLGVEAPRYKLQSLTLTGSPNERKIFKSLTFVINRIQASMPHAMFIILALMHSMRLFTTNV